MNMTAEKRASSNMRKLRKGDRFHEKGELWEVTGQPLWFDGSSEFVRVPMIRVNGGVRQRRYIYRGDHRVTLI